MSRVCVKPSALSVQRKKAFKKIDPDRNCRIYFQHKKLQRIRTFFVQLMPKKMNPASYATTGIKTIIEIPNYSG
jgi:hypothetical protein